MKKFLVVVIVLVMAVILLKGCGNSNNKREINLLERRIEQLEQEKEQVQVNEDEDQIKELQQQLKEANSEKEELEKKANAIANDGNYLNVKFPSDGNFYKEAYDQVQFYSNSACTIKIDNPRFMSPEIDSAQAENGLNIYCLRLDSGMICYCTESPYLITEKKYNEIKSEQQ